MLSPEQPQTIFTTPEAPVRKSAPNPEDGYFRYEKALANAFGISPKAVRIIEKIGGSVLGVGAALSNSSPVEAKSIDIVNDFSKTGLVEQVPAIAFSNAEIPNSVVQLKVMRKLDIQGNQQGTELSTAEKTFLADHPIRSLDVSKNYVALTYDDWPSNPKQLETILDVAKEKNVHLTFFISGKQLQWLEKGQLKGYGWEDDSLIRRMISEGHQVGYHGGEHTAMTTMSDQALQKDAELFLDTFQKKYNYRPVVYRPPYGDTNDRVRRVFAEYGMQEVLWSDGGESGGLVTKDTIATVTKAVSKIPGVIVLSHMQREGDVEAIGNIIDYCKENNLSLTTIDQGRSSSDIYMQADTK